jgi:hypothetical protein
MDQLENVGSFKTLVQNYNRKPRPFDKKKAEMARSEDVIIATRIRPLLEHELEEGQVEGTTRRNLNTVDLYGMTLGLPGGPKLRVSKFIGALTMDIDLNSCRLPSFTLTAFTDLKSLPNNCTKSLRRHWLSWL